MQKTLTRGAWGINMNKNIFKLPDNKFSLHDNIELTENVLNKFISHVDIKSKTECWEWKKTLDKYKYGIFVIKCKLFKAHRVSFLFFNGHLNKSLSVCHTCDNPQCVNPYHLWEGTQQQNNQDRQLKNRTKTGHLYGEANPKAKLTKEDVIFIRKNYNGKEYSTRSLAKKFNVCQTKIRQILKNECWKHI
jgi:hypothetical protein